MNETTKSAGLYDQAIDLQLRLVRRGYLAEVGHDVAYGRFLEDGETLIECTCGRGMITTDARSERTFAEHVNETLRRDLAAAA